MHRGDGAGRGFRPQLHQQSNKAQPAVWFELKHCNRCNAHLK
jgi:hypothetical protein